MKYLSLLKKTTPFYLYYYCFSCASRKMWCYQGIDGIAAQENSNSYEIKIQPDDLLMIIVSAEILKLLCL
jgi:polysaccharide export outer membrane protein